MNTEIKMLAFSIILGLLTVLIAGGLATQQRGLKWNTGNRDGEPKSLTGAAARATRASHNFLETFAFFAAAVLAVVVAGRSTPYTVLGSEIYFWARVAYLPIYIIGIPYLRTAVWAISIWGLLQVLGGLF
jgi:uncharacterized MAPEG superfamily protein